MAIKKYLGKKALKLGKKLFGKKARSAAQKRALAKAVKISAMKRSKNKISKVAKFIKPIKFKGAKKISKSVAKRQATKVVANRRKISTINKARIAILGVYATGVGASVAKKKIDHSAAINNMNRQYVENMRRSFNKQLNKRNPPQLSPELELNAQKQKIQNETEKYLRDMRRKLEQEKRNAKNSIIQNRKTGTI